MDRPDPESFVEEKPGARIRWQPAGELSEAFSSRPAVLQRTASVGSARSLSRRASIDPAVALPIQYRSVSFEIADAQRNDELEQIKAKSRVAAELGNLDWHLLGVEELQKRLQVSPDGLTTDEVEKRMHTYGKNMISPLPTRWLQQIFGYCFKGFGSILLVGAVLVFVSWKPLGNPPAEANLALAIVLVAVFLIQAAFNAWQDWSSSRVMASITALLPESSHVVRNGIQMEVSATDLVPGDVLYIKAGNKLPADIRLIDVSNDASFDRSILTGESMPIGGSVDSTDDNYLETHCIGLQGTHCVGGTGTGIVVSTGDSTVFGHIAKLTSEPRTGLTTLEKEVLRFVIIICSIMLSMIILVIIVWATWLRKNHPDWINVPALIVDCVSVAIAFIPEGLPIALTASLTITANLMANNKILCKSLKTVETLGAVSVICSDKTGTLTKNKMFVTQCAVATKIMTPEGARDEMVTKHTETGIRQLQIISALCNVAEFDAASANAPLAEKPIFGNATDQAVLRFSEILSPTLEPQSMWKKTYELAFNSKNKFMIRTFSLVEARGADFALSSQEKKSFGSEDTLLTIKGAPDILIERCTHFTNLAGDLLPLEAQTRGQVVSIKDRWSSEGKRVILLARKVLLPGTLWSIPSSRQFESEIMDHAKTGLVLVGLVGIVDPPREEIPEVVQALRSAGIRFFMVTGDFSLTALAIARQCGIVTVNGEVHDVKYLKRSPHNSNAEGEKHKPSDKRPTVNDSAVVISGPELITLNEHQWDQLCQYREIVFARTTPEQKLRIVKEFRARDEIVGMTGDGVNDAPSLKAADIGIALGSGSDIAIEAADMVLLESFSAIVEAVRYGRVVFDNLKKTIAYLLPAGSFSEFWPVFTNVLFGLPQVLSSFLMIIICCFTDCAAATVLAYEKPESDVMNRPPRNPKKERLVNFQLMLQSYGFIGVIETVCSFAMAYWYLQRNHISFSILWFGFGTTPTGVSPAQYTARTNEASSVYFVNLVVMQWFNLMAVRTRRLSLFSHPPAFNKQTQNLLLFPAILFALCMAFFWLYIPALQDKLNTTNVPLEHFFLPMAFGLVVLMLDEGRKACVRRWPKGFLAKLAW